MNSRIVLLTLFLTLSTILFGQQISAKKCKDCGKPLANCQYRGNHPAPKKHGGATSGQDINPQAASNTSQRQTFDIYRSNCVTNVRFSIEGECVIVDYDLAYDSDIYLFASTDESDGWNTSFMNWSAYLREAPALRAVSGDVGRCVKKGKNKKIFWNFKEEVAPFFSRSSNGITASFIVSKDSDAHFSNEVLSSLQIRVDAAAPTLEPELVWIDGCDGCGNFWISKYPITLEQFSAFVSETGYKTDAEKKGYGEIWSTTKNDWDTKSGVSWRCDESGHLRPHSDYSRYPVVNVSWRDAMNYCKWLSQKYNRTYQLPSHFDMFDAYSCCVPGSLFGGMRNEDFFHLGGSLNEIGWNNMNSNYKIHPIGTKKQNKNHLYDMVGNCNEWCFEYIDSNGNTIRPKDVKEGVKYNHSGCGGSAFEAPQNFMNTVSYWAEDASGVNIGFRVIMYLQKGQSYK